MKSEGQVEVIDWCGVLFVQDAIPSNILGFPLFFSLAIPIRIGAVLFRDVPRSG